MESRDTYQTYFESPEAVARPTSYKLMDLNFSKLQQIQQTVPFMERGTYVEGLLFDIPLPDGKLHQTRLVETCLWTDKNYAKNIPVKTYSMFNPKTKVFEGNLSVQVSGINAVLFTDNGSIYISPLYNNTASHISFFTKDAVVTNVSCGVDGEGISNSNNEHGRGQAGTCIPKTYRMMLSATGEFTSWAGSVALAQAKMTAIMNIVSAVYKRDMNVFFDLLPNDNFVYTDAASDPFLTGATVDGSLLDQNRSDLLSKLGSANYDMGLVFTRMSSGGGSGLAQLQAVCTAGKGRAAMGHTNPNDTWFPGATAHEIGHNFGATHSFASTSGSNCQNQRSVGSSWEPGSGSTLMAYTAAACGATNSFVNLQELYFHAGSIGQMQSFIGSGATCYSGSANANVAPTATIVPSTSYNIPANTPFVLTLNSTDVNSDALTYTWEQMDVIPDQTIGVLASPTGTDTYGPLFRSLFPSTSNTRYFPALNYQVNGTPYAFEVLPKVARTMNFRGTVRDNSALGGCTNEVNVTLNVQTSNGFKVTNPAWGTVWNKNGSNTAPVVWDVAGTFPTMATTVDIFLSIDGGYTYPITLATTVPNTGSYNVLIPSINTTTGKVMVKGTNNVFFSIQEELLKITDPMPVTYLSFTARKEGSTSLLNWSTATETNSDKFIVERSSNGNDFKAQIGSVKAAGNSTTVQNYNLVDKSPLDGWNYYRLKQFDVDGTFSYSSIVSVYFGKDSKSAIAVYPNPVKDQTTISLYTERSTKVKMEVYDSKGALVSTQTYTSVAGMNRTTLNLQSLSTGIYTLKCYTESELIGVTKLIKN
jgi:hypothetical protein